MNKLVSVLFLVMAIAAAYDFSDSEFNQFLADDLNDLNAYLDSHIDSHGNVRNRRDEEVVKDENKCRPRRKKMCCAEESFEELHEKDKELKRECFKQIVAKDKNRDSRGGDNVDPFRCDKVEKHRKEMTCVMECVGKKKNILDGDGNPVEDEVSKFLKETLVKESFWFEAVQEKVLAACLQEARNATGWTRDTADSDSCNPAGVKLKHCLFREIQLGCPADQIKDQKACQRARDKIARHGEFYPPPPFMNDE